ncbi:hypothetical protein [Lichenibacterium dinghuense]|uniref:hypothetical protein n=1 Tax=Lichenibacterium dinghuense TaxID=2895977 RepID=UPI001F42008D|nr:hypothetical protein [Lichenibacterium sp. 6Y81]
MGADFRLDGSATLRFTTVESLAASGGVAALARLGGRMAAARDALASIRAALDALVALFALAAALAAFARAGSGASAVLQAALVPAAYAVLIPCRRTLLRLALRVLMGAALRLTVPRSAGGT